MVSGQKQRAGEDSTVATYKFKVPEKLDFIIKDIDLEKRTPEDIVFRATAALDPLLRKSDSASEEAMRAVLTGKAQITNAKVATDDKERLIMSCEIKQKKDVLRLSFVTYKDKSVDVVLTDKDGEVSELLSIKKGGKISVYESPDKS